MFDPEKPRVSLKTEEKAPKVGRAPILWEHMTEAERLAHFQDLREFLPAIALKDIDIEQELMLQYQTLKAAQREALDDLDTTTSAKASISNSVSSTLAKVASLQIEIYSSERFKNIELALIRVLNKMPAEQAREFLEEYKKVISK